MRWLSTPVTPEERSIRRRWQRAQRKDTPPLHDTPHAKAASAAGGVLILVPRLHCPPGQNGGCGVPTHVVGTNGGEMPCGSLLTMFGKTAPYYCATCDPGDVKWKQASQETPT